MTASDEDDELPDWFTDAPIPHYYDPIAQRAQAAQHLLMACVHMRDERAVELAYMFIDILIRSIDVKTVRVVK